MSRYSASKNSTLLKDNSWIKKADSEDEDIDKDPNFGKTVLHRHRSSESLLRSEPEDTNTTKPIRTSTSVQALSKRFSAGGDELKSSGSSPSRTSSYTKSTTTSKTVTEEPKSSKTTTTVTKNGTTETTITTQTVRSKAIGSPTQTFTERVKSSSKGAQFSTYSPTKTTRVTETTVTSNKSAEDKLYNTLIPSSIADDFSPTESKTAVSTTETVKVRSSSDSNSAEDKLYDTLIPSSIKNDYTDSKTTVFTSKTVKSSPDGDSIKTITTTRTSSTAEDELYDTLLPKSITSGLSSPVSSTSIRKREIVTVDSARGGESPTLSSPSSTRTISYSSYSDDIPSPRTSSYTISSTPSYDYGSGSSSYTTTYRTSRSDDILSDPFYSKTSSVKNTYASPERLVLEKDLCTYCRKPLSSEPKMVLHDMKINCHASCFKCEVCNSTLGHMKAGDCLWVYKSMVHCENCFDVTREKWKR